MRQAHEQVRPATKSTARTQKSYFDKYVKGNPFHVGQLVWLYWPLPKLRQKNKKLARLWTGPWEVVEFKTSSIVVVIRHTTSQKKQTVHIDRLVPCTKTTSDCTVSPSQVQATSDNTASATAVEDIQHQTMQQPQSKNKITTTGSTRSRRQLPTQQRRSPSYFDNYVLS